MEELEGQQITETEWALIEALRHATTVEDFMKTARKALRAARPELRKKPGRRAMVEPIVKAMLQFLLTAPSFSALSERYVVRMLHRRFRGKPGRDTIRYIVRLIPQVLSATGQTRLTLGVDPQGNFTLETRNREELSDLKDQLCERLHERMKFRRGVQKKLQYYDPTCAASPSIARREAIALMGEDPVYLWVSPVIPSGETFMCVFEGRNCCDQPSAGRVPSPGRLFPSDNPKPDQCRNSEAE